MAHQFYQTRVNFHADVDNDESSATTASVQSPRNAVELEEIAIDSASDNESAQLQQNADSSGPHHNLADSDADSESREDSESQEDSERQEDLESQEDSASAPAIPRSYLSFKSQEHSFIQEFYPNVPDDLVNLIREYTQVEIQGDVTAAEAEYAQQANERPNALKTAMFFVLFGFVMTMAATVFFGLRLVFSSHRWNWIALIIPAAINLLVVPSTSEIWGLHMRARKLLLYLRLGCWAGLLLELVVTRSTAEDDNNALTAEAGTVSVYLFLPLLIDSIFSMYKAVKECYFSQSPPFSLVHISAGLNAVTLWTVDPSSPSASPTHGNRHNEPPEANQSSSSQQSVALSPARLYNPPSLGQIPIPTSVKFNMIAWYPLDNLVVTMYTLHDRAWHAYTVAKIEVRNPLKYGQGPRAAAAPERLEVRVLVPREVQNIILAKQNELRDFMTLHIQKGGLWSGDKRAVLLTDVYREYVLDRDGYMGRF